ncbi:MAG: Lrp/AsnC family transcriptional regulator [Chthoniobacterales bacterium]|nr:Lrp/AsnC family transcriptional regulator [Chthoniobacterales bacterium]
MDALLRILQTNPLLPRAEIAKLLGLEEKEVEAKIAELEAEGVILGYTAIINREKWDPDTVTALIEVKVTPEREGGFDRIAARIARFDEVLSCYLMSGRYDLLVIVQGRTLREVAAFVAEKLSTMEGVQATATHFRLKTYKENGTFHHLVTIPERLPVSP